MATKRRIEVYSAGCAVCDEAVRLVETIACQSCDVNVLDMNDLQVAARANALGIRTTPAIVVDGKLAACCAGLGPDEGALRAAGIGSPIS